MESAFGKAVSFVLGTVIGILVNKKLNDSCSLRSR